MKNIKIKTITIGLVFLFIFFSGYEYLKTTPSEPKGIPVVLSPEELNISYMTPSKREWYGWHRKGLELTKSGSYKEALYCFNMATKVWPKKNTNENSKTKYTKEPTDTILQKAELFLKMNEPELALKYFEKFDSYIPNQKFTIAGIKKAKIMIENKNSD